MAVQSVVGGLNQLLSQPIFQLTSAISSIRSSPKGRWKQTSSSRIAETTESNEHLALLLANCDAIRGVYHFPLTAEDETISASAQDILKNGVKDFKWYSSRRSDRLQNGILTAGPWKFQLNRSGDLTVQRRGFRTRVVQPVGMGGVAKPPAEESFFSLGSIKSGAVMDRLKGANTETADRLKSLLSDTPNVTDQEKIKVAFAEGYLSANKSKTPAGRARMMKLMLNLLLWTLIIYLAIQLFTDGSFRIRVVTGNNSEVFPEEVSVTFNDVRGIEEAKGEVMEIVEYLRDPEKFSRLGGRLPKGVLLVGPPGTGKTLLARAIAGEAGVPFFHASGSEFDEILVGQGARRVRDLFATAKTKAPCVVFIDEIDSVGSKRTSSALHPYANQTINQLLAEMDGFRQNEGVIVLGATNRKDDLDKALLRPGRFDVEVMVNIPDLSGRLEILQLYLGKISKLSRDVDIEILAKGTTGFTGADIENMVNQAALRAAADGRDNVNMKYLEDARDKVLMGPERKSRIPDENTNKMTAYHEGGHTIVSYFTKDALPLHKVTIIPRGSSLGHTAHIADKEQYQLTRAEILATLDTLMGGRVAEELVFGTDKVTTGASDDLRRATSLATQMVKLFGMSDKVGLRTFDDSEKGGFVVVSDLSAATTDNIDSEIKRILSESYERAKQLLKTHAAAHKRLADALLEYETLDYTDIKDIIEGRSLTRNPLH